VREPSCGRWWWPWSCGKETRQQHFPAAANVFAVVSSFDLRAAAALIKMHHRFKPARDIDPSRSRLFYAARGRPQLPSALSQRSILRLRASMQAGGPPNACACVRQRGAFAAAEEAIDHSSIIRPFVASIR
jgi:hypothetical protein